MATRYKLRAKAADKTFYTDKNLHLEHKGIVALLQSWFPIELEFTAEDLSEFTYEDTETIIGYLRELEEFRYIARIE